MASLRNVHKLRDPEILAKNLHALKLGLRGLYWDVARAPLRDPVFVVGSASQVQTFTVSNTGIVVLTVSAATVVGTDGAQFSIQGNTCVAHVIRPSGTCAVSVAFSPASSGSKSAALRIASNDPDSPSIDIPLTGSGMMQQHMLTVNKTGNGIVTSTPAGISCGAACSGLYNKGTTITLTATPSSDSTFDGWSGGTCTGTGTCVITLNPSAGVTATFKPRVYTITASAGTGGTISPIGAVSVASGSNQTPLPSPARGSPAPFN